MNTVTAWSIESSKETIHHLMQMINSMFGHKLKHNTHTHKYKCECGWEIEITGVKGNEDLCSTELGKESKHYGQNNLPIPECKKGGIQ